MIHAFLLVFHSINLLTDVLVFDNTFSRFRSKTVRYRVVIDEAEDTESCAGETSMLDLETDSFSLCL